MIICSDKPIKIARGLTNVRLKSLTRKDKPRLSIINPNAMGNKYLEKKAAIIKTIFYLKIALTPFQDANPYSNNKK